MNPDENNPANNETPNLAPADNNLDDILAQAAVAPDETAPEAPAVPEAPIAEETPVSETASPADISAAFGSDGSGETVPAEAEVPAPEATDFAAPLAEENPLTVATEKAPASETPAVEEATVEAPAATPEAPVAETPAAEAAPATAEAAAPAALTGAPAPGTKKDQKLTIILAAVAGLILIAGIVVIVISLF